MVNPAKKNLLFMDPKEQGCILVQYLWKWNYISVHLQSKNSLPSISHSYVSEAHGSYTTFDIWFLLITSFVPATYYTSLSNARCWMMSIWFHLTMPHWISAPFPTQTKKTTSRLTSHPDQTGTNYLLKKPYTAVDQAVWCHAERPTWLGVLIIADWNRKQYPKSSLAYYRCMIVYCNWQADSYYISVSAKFTKCLDHYSVVKRDRHYTKATKYTQNWKCVITAIDRHSIN